MEYFVGAPAKKPVKKPAPKPAMRVTTNFRGPAPVSRSAQITHAVRASAAVVNALPPRSKAVVQQAKKKAITQAAARPGTPQQKASAMVRAAAAVTLRAAKTVSRVAPQTRITRKPAPPKPKPATAIVKALPARAKAVVRQAQKQAVRKVLASNAPAAAKPALAARAISNVNNRAALAAVQTAQASQAAQASSSPMAPMNDEAVFEQQDYGGSDSMSQMEEPSYDEAPYEDDEAQEASFEEVQVDDPEEVFEEAFEDAGEEPEYSEDVSGCVGCSVSGDLPASASGRGYWVKTHFFREGDFLCATTYLVANGEPEILHFKVDLKRALALVVRYHQQLHGSLPASDDYHVSGCVGCDIFNTHVGGIFGSIYNAAKKVATSSIVKKVTGGVRSVIRSKALGAAVAATAVVFPPVGVPAVAGYAAANAAIIAIEKGGAVAKEVKGLLKKAKAKPALKKSILAKVKSPAVIKALKDASTAKKVVKGVQQAAAAHTDPRKRADAQATLKVLELTAKNRAKLKEIAAKSPSSVTGLVVDNKGQVMHGKFVEAHQANGAIPHLFLAAKGQTTRGYFQKVSGCIGCGG